MRGETIITLDEPIRYSENGSFSETHTITVRAPGLGKRHVHATMQAWVMEAISNLQNKRADLMKQAEAEAKAKNPLNVDDPEPGADGKDDTGEDPLGVWQMMSMGLGPERFPRFQDYIMRELTGTPKLASVGDNGSPLTDAVWESLDETGGMDAVGRVLGTFAGFFTGAPKSKKPSGNVTSPSSPSPVMAGSRSNTRANSRSRN